MDEPNKAMVRKAAVENGFVFLSPRPLQAGYWCSCARTATECEIDLALETTKIMKARAQTLECRKRPKREFADNAD